MCSFRLLWLLESQFFFLKLFILLYSNKFKRGYSFFKIKKLVLEKLFYCLMFYISWPSSIVNDWKDQIWTNLIKVNARMLHNIVSSLSHCWFLRIRILFFNNNENNRHNASYSWQMIAKMILHKRSIFTNPLNWPNNLKNNKLL